MILTDICFILRIRAAFLPHLKEGDSCGNPVEVRGREALGRELRAQEPIAFTRGRRPRPGRHLDLRGLGALGLHQGHALPALQGLDAELHADAGVLLLQKLQELLIDRGVRRGPERHLKAVGVGRLGEERLRLLQVVGPRAELLRRSPRPRARCRSPVPQSPGRPPCRAPPC